MTQHSDGQWYVQDGQQYRRQPYGSAEGTSGNDVIDYNYIGDPDGDKIDHNDQILSGVAMNDDLIYGYGGNDTALAGEGNDIVYGGDGNDAMYGCNGNDAEAGGTGNEALSGGAGADHLYGGEYADHYSGGTACDAVDGGKGDYDHDVLDLTGVKPLHIILRRGQPGKRNGELP